MSAGFIASAISSRPRSAPNKLTTTDIDLSPWLEQGLGHLVLIVQGSELLHGWPQRSTTWVQSTRIGLHASVDPHQAYVWATRLADGAALPGAQVELVPGGTRARTDSDGMAQLSPLTRERATIVAHHGLDTAFLPDAGRLIDCMPRDRLRWFMFDDGGLYRPGETLHAKGWVRLMEAGPGGGLDPVPHLMQSRVKYEAIGPRGEPIASDRVPLDPSGGFHLSLRLPVNVNLGSAKLWLDLEQPALSGYLGEYQHDFSINEFRRPEYEVDLSLSQGPYRVGEHAVAMVRATYYTDGGLPSAPARWKVTTSPAHYRPPNWKGYHFGAPTRRPRPRRSPRAADPSTVEWLAHTAHDGRHRVRLDFDPVEPPYPRHVQLAASVRDISYQEWTTKDELLVHPADVCVGAKPLRHLVRPGEPISLELVVTDLDGRVAVGRPVSVSSVRVQRQGHSVQARRVELGRQTTSFTSEPVPHRLALPTLHPGLHELTIRAQDAQGRNSQTQLDVWVDCLPLPSSIRQCRRISTTVLVQRSLAKWNIRPVFPLPTPLDFRGSLQPSTKSRLPTTTVSERFAAGLGGALNFSHREAA
ncbi:hypothetical protein ACFL5O_09750 [Myxococcota bacterium]